MKWLILTIVVILAGCTNVLEGPNDCTKVAVEYPDFTGVLHTDTGSIHVVDGIVYREVSNDVPGYDSVALNFTFDEACIRDTAVVYYGGL